ncbi:ABC transporter ATP-binding protein [Paramicrobacterium chengjingii]|uniref:ABC transporter ATP-binding protein n=1 Tax=Paramicrobacterium chengjingii TaxID=2769067 RepID=UPI0014242120|nr:ABC transporter ATP-binding protein [Microbacterium chengjingii]
MQRTVQDSSVSLDNVRIEYGGNAAVKNASFTIASGEFFTLLGPSGCGKTTLLRTIAGFNRQTSGTIRIGSTTIDDLPAHRRDTGMVFQNYAIFPHLNVRENIAYGLRARKLSKTEIDSRVKEALEMVDLTRYADRKPQNLSGGQQQRVVIARAIVVRPRVLLMDEPLANLDAKLRVRLRNDVRALQQELGITTIYVTHDQEEALDISDRIAVMSKGEVLQVGAPEEIYATPQHLFVAQFVGEGTFLPAQLRDDGRTAVLSNGTVIPVRAADAASGACNVGLRPEELNLARDDERADFDGTIVSRSYLGPHVQLRVDIGLEQTLLLRVPAAFCPRSAVVGASARVALAVDAAVFRDGESTATDADEVLA